MEQLLTEQKAELEAFRRLYLDFEKLNVSELSVGDVKSKLQTVKKKFEIIENRDEIIKQYQTGDNADQPYFKKGLFADVQALNAQFTSKLNELIKQAQNLRPRLTGFELPLDGAAASNELTTLQMQNMELTDLFENADLMDHNSQPGEIKTILSLMSTVWTELRTACYRERAAGNGIPFEYGRIQQQYIRSSGKLNDLLDKRPTTSNQVNTQFSLPKLQLPKFNGKPSEWKGFIALFDRMVHNNLNLDNGLKIEYLKTCVEGEASRLINHVDPTPENYILCYETLKKRFDNKREIMCQLLDQMLKIPKMKSEDGNLLKNIHDTTYESIMAIQSIGIDLCNSDNMVLAHIMLHKLDVNTIMNYECQLKDVREPQSLKNLLEYMENRFMAIRSAHLQTDNFSHTKKFEKKSTEKNITGKCILCNEAHILFKCTAFGKKTVQERMDFARNKRLCMNCFSDQHKTAECKSNYSCKTCSKKHNSLLHLEQKSGNSKETKSNVVNVDFDKNENVELSANLAINANSTMLATAIVGVEAKNKQKIALRALIDPGSQSSFITQNALQTLNMKGRPVSINISGISELTKSACSAIELNIYPRFTSTFLLRATVIVLNKITKYKNDFDDLKSYEHLKHLLLADPTLTDSAPIDILLGADVYSKFLKSGVIKGLESEPIAQNTEFGWIVTGPSMSKIQTSTCVNVVSLVSNVELEKKIKSFFEIEEFREEKKMTDEEEQCEQYFQKTHTRTASGRYVVSIPFINGIEYPVLGDSRKCAIAHQLQLERRFAKNPQLQIDYQAFIHEFINLGQMEVATESPIRDAYYLPHHCVYKESTTTKLRVVFNASQRTTNGKSLNDQLAIGAIEQPDLVHLLIKFRFFKYAFTADLEKMYRQILVAPEFVDLQRIIWRDSTLEPLREFIIKTVTYGTAIAPHLATRVLKQLAFDVADKYPIAAEIIRKCMYMDDVLSGCFSIPELRNAYSELKASFESAGFNLRKWCSNSQELLEIIPEGEKELKATNENVKALGISWSAIDDEFTYEHQIQLNTNPNTKRILLSEIASLFDPLGWISPVIIRAKHLLQLLWKEGLGWDTTMPSEFIEAWQRVKSELHLINKLTVPRWVKFMPNETNELHGFCDASEIGYAAVIYIKNVESNSVTLLIAKAKVAPIKGDKLAKNATIPRLELCGAMLLTELTKLVLDACQFPFQRIRLWTDSKIVLGWINGNPKRYKTFVANKICKINDLIDRSNWLHVPGEHNPADCASRGMLPSQLVNHSLWWNGPEFLKNEANYDKQDSIEFQTDIEVNIHSHTTINHVSILPDVSSFYRMKKVIAYCLRFAHNGKRNINSITGLITAEEMNNAERAIVRYVQAEAFPNEIRALKRGENIPISSSLRRLGPKLDDNNIIRVGGRLERAEISCDAKNPIVLPKRSHVSSLIIRAAHLKCMHGGPRLTEASVRQRFWVLNSQNEVKKITNSCIICFKQKNRTMTQVMAQLPKCRVNMLEKVFTNTLVDYTGAFQIKISKGRGVKTSKAYVCIFICMATKAIHVELVSDLTAETYIAAFRRLVARRGSVKNLYSDNGTCFIRADKDLRDLSEIEKEEFNTKICNEFTKQGTTWHFSPPAAPHFNGLVEAAVKSVKTHLKKTIGEVKMTYEEFTTVLNQVEACVNSRPLCAMSSNPDDLESLTPGHFLVGGPLLAPPDESFLETNANWLSRWQLVQKISQTIWKRFRDEYLTQLQERSKWFHVKSQPKINELVLIKEENVPPCQWPMARIIEVHKGDDDLIRVVTVKMKNNVFKRPITKLAPLPIQYDEEKQTEIRAHMTRVSNAMPVVRVNVLPIIISLLAIFATGVNAFPVQAMSNPITISRFDTPPGLYFEEKYNAYTVGASWNVISFIDLRGLRNEFMSIKLHVSRLRDHCSVALYASHCDNIVSHLEISIDRLKDQNDMIFSDTQKSRVVRSVLDPVGNILGDLLGIADSRFKLEYQNDMRNVLNNDDHLLLLIKNHTSVIETTLNILKDGDRAIMAQNKHIVSLNKKINENQNSTNAELLFNTIVMQIEQLISDYQQQQHAIFQVLWYSERGSINHNLFTPKQVEEVTKSISNHVGSKFLVPEGGDIYRISDVTSFKSGDQLIFKISIPLLNPQKLKIYKIIQVPQIHDNQLWWIYKSEVERFLITSTGREVYQFMQNLDDCIQMRDDIVICERTQRWTRGNTRYCSWNIFNQMIDTDCQTIHEPAHSMFIELANPNKFIFICPIRLKLSIFCGEIVAHSELIGEGILELAQQCFMRTDDQEFRPKRIFGSTSSEIVIPKIPHFVIPKNEMFQINDQTDEELNTVENSSIQNIIATLLSTLNETKINSKLESNVNVHDVHQYVVMYCIVSVMLVFIIRSCCRNRKQKSTSITHVIPTSTTNVIELPIPAPRNIRVPSIVPRQQGMVSMPDVRVWETGNSN